MGVTVYEVAGMARAVTASVAEGRKAAEGIAGPLEVAYSSLWKALDNAAYHGGELAHHTARGAMHAARGVPRSTDAAYDVMLAVTGSMAPSTADTREIVRGTAAGTIRGAHEAGLDLGRAAQCLVRGASEASGKAGLPSGVAVTEAVNGIMEAAEVIGPEAVAQAAEALGPDLGRSSGGTGPAD